MQTSSILSKQEAIKSVNVLFPELKLLSDIQGVATFRFIRSRLTSVFQPVFELSNGAASGAQALVRTFDSAGAGLSPWTLFGRAVAPELLLELDRRCRAMHLLNAPGGAGVPLDLYLNVHERLLSIVAEGHGKFFSEFARVAGARNDRIVICLPELTDINEALLVSVLSNYQQAGFRVAVSPLDLAQLKRVVHGTAPDVIRIDAQRFSGLPTLRRAIALARDHAPQALVKRIGTTGELSDAIDAGATHLQGFLLARPVTTPDRNQIVCLEDLAPFSGAESAARRSFSRQWVA